MQFLQLPLDILGAILDRVNTLDLMKLWFTGNYDLQNKMRHAVHYVQFNSTQLTLIKVPPLLLEFKCLQQFVLSSFPVLEIEPNFHLRQLPTTLLRLTVQADLSNHIVRKDDNGIEEVINLAQLFPQLKLLKLLPTKQLPHKFFLNLPPTLNNLWLISDRNRAPCEPPFIPDSITKLNLGNYVEMDDLPKLILPHGLTSLSLKAGKLDALVSILPTTLLELKVDQLTGGLSDSWHRLPALTSLSVNLDLMTSVQVALLPRSITQLSLDIDSDWLIDTIEALPPKLTYLMITPPSHHMDGSVFQKLPRTLTSIPTLALTQEGVNNMKHLPPNLQRLSVRVPTFDPEIFSHGVSIEILRVSDGLIRSPNRIVPKLTTLRLGRCPFEDPSTLQYFPCLKAFTWTITEPITKLRNPLAFLAPCLSTLALTISTDVLEHNFESFERLTNLRMLRLELDENNDNAKISGSVLRHLPPLIGRLHVQLSEVLHEADLRYLPKSLFKILISILPRGGNTSDTTDLTDFGFRNLPPNLRFLELPYAPNITSAVKDFLPVNLVALYLGPQTPDWFMVAPRRRQPHYP